MRHWLKRSDFDIDLVSSEVIKGTCWSKRRAIQLAHYFHSIYKVIKTKLRLLAFLSRCPINNSKCSHGHISTWWRHQMETFSALLVICAGNPMVTGEFPAQSPATGSFDVFFDLRLNKQLSKQWWGWWFETWFEKLYDTHVIETI